MRRRLTALVLLLPLALAGCGDGDGGDDGADGGDAGGGRSASLEPCGELSAAAVEGLTGTAVEVRETSFAGGGTCTFVDAEEGEEGPVLLVVAQPGDATIDEIVEETALDPASATYEEVDVPGAEAYVVEDTVEGIASRDVIAVVDGGYYGVSAFDAPSLDDEARIATAAATALLGGAISVPAPVDVVVPPPCQVLTADAVSAVLGSTVTAEEDDSLEAFRACSYAADDLDVPRVSLYDYEDRPRLDALRALAGDDAEVVDVSADGLREAVVIARDETSSVSAYADAGDATYSIELYGADDTDAAVDLARRLLTALGEAVA